MRNQVPLSTRGIDVNMNGRKILGSPFGPTPQSLAYVTEAIVREHDKMLDVLESPHMDPKVAHLILRMCMAPRLCYLMRTMPPPLIDETLRTFDARLQDTFLKISRIPRHCLSELALLQIHLPLRLAGMGIRTTAFK